LEFLATKITANIRELEGALNRIAVHGTLSGRGITLQSAQELLRDLLRSNEHYVSIEDIQRKVCEYYNLKISDLLSDRRVKTLARPRQLAIYLSKLLTSKSLPDIGRKFGGRDHTTVLHSVRKIQELILNDPEIQSDIQFIRRSLESV
jgi:chromosomal replication initiator protein